MPRFKCPGCGREKVIISGKVKNCMRCNIQFVPLEPDILSQPKKRKHKSIPLPNGNPVAREQNERVEL